MYVLGVLAWGWCGRGSAAVEEANAEDDPSPLEIHGFVSQGFILTTANNYLAKSHQGSFEFTEVGINLTKPLTDKLRTGVQLFARDLGPIGDYSAKIDWAYLDYHWRDWLGFRVGRVKIPFGLYNETSDIDAARASVLLPQSVYPTTSRDYLLAQTGVDLYGYRSLGGAGALDYRVYTGTIFTDSAPLSSDGATILESNIPFVVGSRLLWETPAAGLRLGGSTQKLLRNASFLYPTQAVPVTADVTAQLGVASLEYAAHDLVVAGEYSRWGTEVDSTDQTLIPNSHVISERAYGLVAYRVKPWLQPCVYYSLLYPDVRNRSGRANLQGDVAATVRFDVNTHWIVKVEAHYMRGTAALSPTLNDRTPLSALQPEWGVFLVKTTGYF